MTSTKVNSKHSPQSSQITNMIKLGKSKSSDFVPDINEKIQCLMSIEDLKIKNVAVIGYN